MSDAAASDAATSRTESVGTRALALGRWALVGEGPLAAAEVVLVAAFILTTLWMIGPNVQMPGMARLTLVSFGFVFPFCVYLSPRYLHGQTREERGLGPARTLFIRTDNLVEAGKSVGALTLGAVLLMVFTAWARDPGFATRISWRALGLRFAFYLFSAGLQAAILFPFFLLRIRQLVSDEAEESENGSGLLKVAVSFGLVFSAFHAPNLPIMVLSFAAGAVWASVFLRTPNLFVIVLSHAVLGTVAHKVVGLSMRIGPFYAESEKVFLIHVIPALAPLRSVLYGP